MFRISCSSKTFNRWLPWDVWIGWLHLCVMGTWVPSWGDVILIWYHYIVICAFVTIFNWQLSIKGMKLWILIKEALIVIYWLTLCIILLCSLASWHQALLLEKRLHKALGQPVICNSRYYTENLRKSTCALNVYWFHILDLFLNIIFSRSRKKLNSYKFLWYWNCNFRLESSLHNLTLESMQMAAGKIV